MTSVPCNSGADDLLDILGPGPRRALDRDDERRRDESAKAGERLMVARMNAGVSRNALAKALGIARQTLMNWEEAGGQHRVPTWLYERLPFVAPEVARELFRSHALDLRRVG